MQLGLLWINLMVVTHWTTSQMSSRHTEQVESLDQTSFIQLVHHTQSVLFFLISELRLIVVNVQLPVVRSSVSQFLFSVAKAKIFHP